MTNPEKNFTNYNPIPVIDTHLEFIVPADCAGMRLDQALQRLLPDYSRSRMQSWIVSGRICLDGVATTTKHKVWGGEKITVVIEPEPGEMAFTAEDIPFEILYEDESLLVVNKAAGMVVHPGSGNWQGTLLNALLQHLPDLAGVPRAGIVHRLDKDTSGLLVVAKNLISQTSLVRQLQARTVSREYLAVVQGEMFGNGKVDAPLGRHPTQRTKMAIVQNGKPAVTYFNVLEQFDGFSLVRCKLETGRTHQIRVHMLSLGHPLVGDPVYFSKTRRGWHSEAVKNFKRQALHAEKLALIHPHSGQEMAWQSPIPEDMAALLDSLRKDVEEEE